MISILSLGIFSAVPEMMLFDYFFSVALTVWLAVIPIILTLLIIQRS